MEFSSARSIGQFIRDKNIVLRGADAATAMGFTQLPNFLLKSKKLSSGDKMTFAMLLSYAWQNDFCFPGQARLALDMGITERSVRTHLKSLEANGLLEITQRGLGKTNVYVLMLKPPGRTGADRKKTSGLDRNKTTAPDRSKTSGPL